MVRPKPNKLVIDWILSKNEKQLFLSVITLGEIQKGISTLGESKKKKMLTIWLQTEMRERFDGRILPIDEQVALTWGDMLSSAEQVGIIIPSIDGLIAATGIACKMTIVTRNIQDMKATGALLFNPWSEL
jgi:predicted nucleic acid-binding protein